MPIDLQKEKVLTLCEAAKDLPALNGRRPHSSSLWRWCRRGLRGVHLEYVRLGGRICTSSEALSRFANALAAADTNLTKPVPSLQQKATLKIRQHDVERAEKYLRKNGL